MVAGPAFEIPRDRHYDGAQHLWARKDEESGSVRVGMDAIGLESLGELAYISLKPPGEQVARGDPMGTLEAAKMTTTIAAPCSGMVLRCNEAVLRDPLLVNSDPYETGWLVELEPGDWARESADFVTGDAIDSWVAVEVERLRSESSPEG